MEARIALDLLIICLVAIGIQQFTFAVEEGLEILLTLNTNKTK